MFALEAAAAPYGLRPLSLHIATGERVALCGPNGAGKSTLIKLLAGLLRPTSGQVVLAGRVRWAARARARQVAVVAQADTLAPEYTVEECVTMGRYAHRRPLAPLSAADREAIDAGLARADLMDLRARPVATLSGGERQRVALARALAQQAPALLLDEPTAHLDIGRAAAFLTRVAELDATVVCAIHDLNLAAQFAPRVLLIDDGEVVGDGPPGEVLTAHQVQRVFGAQVHALRHPVTGAPQFLPEGLNARR